jgi:ketosteroid isomerase-like protein
MKADANTEKAVLEFLDAFTGAYKRRDLDALMALIAPDDDVFMFGTGIDEKRIGPEEFKHQAERDWSQTDALSFNFSSHQISAAGPVAWVAAEGLSEGQVGGQAIRFPLRMTAVLERRGDRWLMVQGHVSVPAAGQEEGDSVPV